MDENDRTGYKEVYCHECGAEVCQTCGCCACPSCSNHSCPDTPEDYDGTDWYYD